VSADCLGIREFATHERNALIVPLGLFLLQKAMPFFL
jgi:hypothetical protein